MSFTADLSRYAAQTKSDIGTAKRAIVLQVFERVIKKTPVDTGRAKGAWVVNADGNMTDDDSPLGSIDAQSAAKLGAITPDLGIDVLQNNLPYIERLEFGYSSQAPAGMVRTTLREFIQIANKEGWK